MIRTALTYFALAACAAAAPHIDEEAFGKSMGGWKGKSVSYSLSGSEYKTYKPEISPTPDGGIFISIRIDHVRGWLSSDDHAVLEITVAPNATIASAQSSLALQGVSISSDLIRGSANAGAHVGGVGAAVKIGGDLVADLSSKLLREKIVEAGRVSFPAAIRHNYNHLYQAIRTEDGQAPPPMPAAKDGEKKEAEKPKEGEKPKDAAKPAEANKPSEPAKPAEAAKPVDAKPAETKPAEAKAPENAKLEIKPIGSPQELKK
ncbi:hypothetical protein KBB96_17390 [Luteolibacter ambystomatis]|uniref:Uncharacterized protein n=1 Tax=Luteolibacter ambystomatis TaxID=2824561 RepID=A0A975IZX3_9BACT|nr:hypothetical protein [Luteolibacter ambystomatis]QUE50625.1 hypothetical protein KBB96_17390 [Luteolibacter ambystomatis]